MGRDKPSHCRRAWEQQEDEAVYNFVGQSILDRRETVSGGLNSSHDHSLRGCCQKTLLPEEIPPSYDSDHKDADPEATGGCNSPQTLPRTPKVTEAASSGSTSSRCQCLVDTQGVPRSVVLPSCSHLLDTIDWQKLSDTLLPHRTPKSIRERWRNHLDPSINHGPWSAKEDDILFRAVEEHGTSWTYISSLLEGRPELQCKNRYYATVRKQRRRQKRGKESFIECERQKESVGENPEKAFNSSQSMLPPVKSRKVDSSNATSFWKPPGTKPGNPMTACDCYNGFLSPPTPTPPYINQLSYQPPLTYQLQTFGEYHVPHSGLRFQGRVPVQIQRIPELQLQHQPHHSWHDCPSSMWRLNQGEVFAGPHERYSSTISSGLLEQELLVSSYQPQLPQQEREGIYIGQQSSDKAPDESLVNDANTLLMLSQTMLCG